jgi:hypothetical protein
LYPSSTYWILRGREKDSFSHSQLEFSRNKKIPRHVHRLSLPFFPDQGWTMTSPGIGCFLKRTQARFVRMTLRQRD